MADLISISITSDPLQNALARLWRALEPPGLRIALVQIGERLAESTRQRFITGTAPDGSRWTPNAEATYLRYLDAPDRGKNTRKDDRLNARGARQAANKRPLIDTGNLMESIGWQIVGDGLYIGTNWGDFDEGAAVHQFGSTRAGRGHNTVIPARPFLGLSAADETTVLDIIERHVQNAAGG
ncbi:MAG: phage virion morphogenesis protein [Azoarcus sp.]|jgi:phage virion morphogenesis protein|nr:phage virion morphogenesis protein [Azoarcus sp.]